MTPMSLPSNIYILLVKSTEDTFSQCNILSLFDVIVIRYAGLEQVYAIVSGPD